MLFKTNLSLLLLSVSISSYSSDFLLKKALKSKVKKAYAKEVKDYEEGRQVDPAIMRRDVHVKANACVKAQFDVSISNTIPEIVRQKLAQGIFAKTASYPAVIRYSNGNKTIDNAPDARGMAIKIAGITIEEFGKKAIDREFETQDFVLLTGRSFFLETTWDYIKFAVSAEKFLFKRPDAARNFQEIMEWGGTMVNPLRTEYQSTVPYALKDAGKNGEIVKYSARPCQGVLKAENTNKSENYLTEALEKSLSSGGACYKFLVQLAPKDIDALDTLTVWDENVAPFYEVATLKIAQQDVSSKDRIKYCENLSFNPWHSTKSHKPLGSVNQIRKSIYKVISNMRRIKNLGSIPAEPTYDEIKDL